MMKISLLALRMFGYHGIYKEEKAAGAEFEISLDLAFIPAEKIGNLEQTINYVEVYRIVRDNMNIPTALLETVLQRTVMGLKEKFPAITEINMSIRKISPPIPNFRGELSVSLYEKF